MNPNFLPPEENYEFYTDGSAKGSYCSWAYIQVQNEVLIREVFGRVDKADSNRMEFHAVIEALNSVTPGSKVTIYTDSRILIEKVLKFPEWRSNNWVKLNGSPIRYVEYFKILDSLLSQRDVTLKWVKAHSGNIWNERCDEICVRARS